MSNVKIEIEISKGYEDYMEQASKKMIHLVCIASLEENSYCFRLYKDLVPQIKISDISNSIQNVNTAKEVGCLFPYANLSIIPSSDLELGLSENILVKYLTELIFEANERYVKSSTLVFILDSPMINYKTLSVALDKVISHRILSETGKKLNWLDRIILA